MNMNLEAFETHLRTRLAQAQTDLRVAQANYDATVAQAALPLTVAIKISEELEQELEAFRNAVGSTEPSTKAAPVKSEGSVEVVKALAAPEPKGSNTVDPEAPFGRKKDGTPKKRPGVPPKNAAPAKAPGAKPVDVKERSDSQKKLAEDLFAILAAGGEMKLSDIIKELTARKQMPNANDPAGYVRYHLTRAPFESSPNGRGLYRLVGLPTTPEKTVSEPESAPADTDPEVLASIPETEVDRILQDADINIKGHGKNPFGSPAESV
jgi:hypothetical protein